MNREKIKATVFIVFVLVFSVQGIRLILDVRRQGMGQSSHPLKAKGQPRAALRVVEYTDFQCPACAKGNEVLQDFVKRYPQQLYVEYRHFPLEMHPHALPIAIAAECAAQQNKFWEYHDLAFNRQNLLKATINLSSRLTESAAEVGLDQVKFDRCVADPSTLVTVQAERDEGKARKVNATPSYFVNDQMLVGSTALKQELTQRLGEKP